LKNYSVLKVLYEGLMIFQCKMKHVAMEKVVLRVMGFVVILHEHSTQWYDSEQVYQIKYGTPQKNCENTQLIE
jgi:hypothetical protein